MISAGDGVHLRYAITPSGAFSGSLSLRCQLTAESKKALRVDPALGKLK